jgi:hypothetical protein
MFLGAPHVEVWSQHGHSATIQLDFGGQKALGAAEENDADVDKLTAFDVGHQPD